MKLKKLLFVMSVTMLVAVLLSGCNQSSPKAEATDSDTELVVEKGDKTEKCGGDADSKCGEGKCGEGKEESDTTVKCGEGKCGEGKSEDEEKKCGEGKCGA
jgi:uncharacterized low-complexity protein